MLVEAEILPNTMLKPFMNSSPAPLRLVLIANRHQHNDGQGRVNYEVAIAALNRGMKVTLLTAYCAEEIANHPNAQFVPIGKEQLPTQLLRNLAFAHESARWLRDHRGEFDLVQANGFVTWESCDVVTAHFVHTSFARSPYYPFARSLRPYALYQRLFTALNARWERRAFRSAKRIIAVSDAVAEEVQQLGVPSERIKVIYNGVDIDEFSPGAGERASFNLPLDVPLGLFVGDIRTWRKNLDTLLHAMQRIPHLHLAVAGEVKRSPAPALAKKLKVADRVHFLGKTPRIPMLMRSVDLFIFPSRYEPYGLVALEAMASGLPVILSRNVGSLKALGDSLEIVEDPEDAAALAASISSVLDSPGRRESMARSGRQRALELSWSNMAAGYVETYESMSRISVAGSVHGS
jgi:glycosyltransferase involved in cell wall biosynthesis